MCSVNFCRSQTKGGAARGGASNNFQVLKMAPSLVVTEGQVDEFVCKLARVVESIHSSATFWSEALGLARRVVNI